jgi:hypothetical protein
MKAIPKCSGQAINCIGKKCFEQPIVGQRAYKSWHHRFEVSMQTAERKKCLHLKTNWLSRFKHRQGSEAERPDECVKESPKMLPNILCKKTIDNFYRRKKLPQNVCYFCNFQITSQSKQIPNVFESSPNLVTLFRIEVILTTRTYLLFIV